MKLLYLSCHEILEYDELKMFNQMGYEVYSHGAYLMPGGQEGRKRPPIDNLPYNPHFVELCMQYSKESLHPEMLEGMDAVIIMHKLEWLELNWPVLAEFKAKGGRIIWRSIGQTVPRQEQTLSVYRSRGVELVRYSPKEETIRGYAGCDALIRFGKDASEFEDWTGTEPTVVNFTQSLNQRAKHCGYDLIWYVSNQLPVKVYGPGNDDLPNLNGGLLSYEAQKTILQSGRAYLYHGTYPASYTLAFMEAWLAGIPVVGVGELLGNGQDFHEQRTYEVAELLRESGGGLVGDTPDAMVQHLSSLLNDMALSQHISDTGRQAAAKLFDYSVIIPEWRKLLE